MKTFLTYLMVVSLFFFMGCRSSDAEQTADVSGKWVSYSVTDKDQDSTAPLPSFTLDLNQSIHDLNGSFTMSLEINELNITSDVTGQIEGVDFKLSGQFSIGDLNVNGLWENNDSMQMTVSINIDENNPESGIVYHALMRRPAVAETTFPLNSYELVQQCGTSGSHVILVHGLMSDATKWDTMIDHFRDSRLCETHQVWTYQYDWQKHISASGQDFVARVDAEHFDDPPVIIASSMGGLVSRSYIKQGGDFERLITIATPHLGSALTDIIGVFHGIQDMEPGSGFLNALNTDAYETSRRSDYLLLNGKVGRTWVCTKYVLDLCVWGHYDWYGSYPALIKLGYVALSKPNDGMVPQSSSRFDGDDMVSRVDADEFEWIHHTGLPVNDRVIDFMIEQLQEVE